MKPKKTILTLVLVIDEGLLLPAQSNLSAETAAMGEQNKKLGVRSQQMTNKPASTSGSVFQNKTPKEIKSLPFFLAFLLSHTSDKPEAEAQRLSSCPSQVMEKSRRKGT